MSTNQSSARPDFAFHIEPVQIRNGTGFVVRDDLLEGGTKQRAIVPFLRALQRQGYSEFVYASPFSGFAQVALASAIKFLDIKCTVFCEEAEAGRKHRFSLLAELLGARVNLCQTLAIAEARANSYCLEDERRYKIPLGFDVPAYRDELAQALRSLWKTIQESHAPQNLWLPVGSGTLAQTFRELVDPNITLQCIDVHVLKSCDNRIQRVRDLENTHYHSADLEFHQESAAQCPVPSNLYYDCKVYDVFANEAADGDIWWNVAR